jgi:adenosine phosphosulfate reductase beta subunit
MVLDPNVMKAYNQEPDQCWECFSCVKICPPQTIEVRGYSDFVPLGSSIMPIMGTEDVMWKCKFRKGVPEGQHKDGRFIFPKLPKYISSLNGLQKWENHAGCYNYHVLNRSEGNSIFSAERHHFLLTGFLSIFRFFDSKFSHTSSQCTRI